MLEPGQAGAFWTLYDEYLEGVRGLTEQRAVLVRDIALAFEEMSDANANAVALGRRALELDERRSQHLADYFDRIAEALGGRTAAQFLQIENRIATLKDMRLMMEIPIIG